MEQVIHLCISHTEWIIDACRINELDGLLQHRAQVLAVVEEEADEIAAKFGSDRRTLMSSEASSAMSMEDIIPNSQSLVVYSKKATSSAFLQTPLLCRIAVAKACPSQPHACAFPIPSVGIMYAQGTPLDCPGSSQFAAGV